MSEYHCVLLRQGARFVVVLLLLALAMPLVTAPAASAADRVALVVGNSEYVALGRLDNPGNDATDLEAALSRLGFDVTTARNADRATMNEALRQFTRESVGAEVALVFYAGHGLEMDGVNYLIPVDAQLERDTDVRFETVVLDDVLAATEGARLRVVILDACRDNPLVRSMQRTSASRSVSRGSFGELREDLLGNETLVAYAAAAGTTAADGTGSRNSPYSTALLEYLEQPLEIGILFRSVRARVLERTNGRQHPHEYASLLREHYLKGTSAPEAATATAETNSVSAALVEQDTTFWRSIVDSDNPADFEAYLRQFPAGAYRALATNRLVAPQAVESDPPSTDPPPVAPASVPAATPTDSRGPVAFMFGNRQGLSRQCPRIRFTQDLRQANLLLFDHRFHLELRDAYGSHARTYYAVRHENRVKDMCEEWGSFSSWNGPTVQELTETVEGVSPQTDPAVPVVFLGGLFGSDDKQAFTRRCSPVRLTQILDHADFIIIYYGEEIPEGLGRFGRSYVGIYGRDGNLLKHSAPLRRRNIFKDMCETVRSR